MSEPWCQTVVFRPSRETEPRGGSAVEESVRYLKCAVPDWLVCGRGYAAPPEVRRRRTTTTRRHLPPGPPP